MTNRQLQENLHRYELYNYFCQLNGLKACEPTSLQEYLKFEKEEAF